MNQLKVFEQQQTMSSREIAELTGKDHKNVTRDVMNMLTELGVDALSFERIYFDSQNRRQIEYHLPKRETYLLITGYSVKLRAKVIDRWQELEKGNNPIALMEDPHYLRNLLLNYTGKVTALENKVAEQTPKVEALHRIADAEGGVNVTEAAKALQMHRKELTAWLVEQHWIYKRSAESSWLSYQTVIDRGLTKHKVVIVEQGDKEFSRTTMLITPKGMARIAVMLEKELVE